MPWPALPVMKTTFRVRPLHHSKYPSSWANSRFRSTKTLCSSAASSTSSSRNAGRVTGGMGLVDKISGWWGPATTMPGDESTSSGRLPMAQAAACGITDLLVERRGFRAGGTPIRHPAFGDRSGTGAARQPAGQPPTYSCIRRRCDLRAADQAPASDAQRQWRLLRLLGRLESPPAASRPTQRNGVGFPHGRAATIKSRRIRQGEAGQKIITIESNGCG